MTPNKRIESLYVTSREPGAGSMVLALGLMSLLRRRYGRIALFRPLVFEERDRDLETLRREFGLSQSPKSSRGIGIEEAERIVAEEGLSVLMERILEHYEALNAEADFIFCLGSRVEGLNRELGMDLNIELAKNLSAPVAGVFSMAGEGPEALEESFGLWSAAIRRQGAEIFLLCANRCCEEVQEAMGLIRQEGLFDFPTACLPRVEALEWLSIEDLMEHLPLEWVAGEPRQRLNYLQSIRVGTLHLQSLLKEFKPYEFLVTASDRADLLTGLLLSAQSVATPMPAGILLCGPRPDEALFRLLEGLDDVPIPVLYTNKYEYELAPSFFEIKPGIRPGDRRRIDTALELFESHIDTEELQQRLSEPREPIVTPAMFRVRIFEQAKRELKRILLPEIEDDRILKAAESLLRRKVVIPVLVGSEEEIRRRERLLGLDLTAAERVDPADEKLIERFADLYYAERKHKGVTREMARDRVSANKTLFATMALYDGRADGLVSGAIHSTRDTISPALQVIKTKEGYPLASSCFFMCLPTRVLVYADCAVNPEPTADELAVIALETVETAERFGIEPRVAMLSYSTGDSGVGPDVEKVRRATELLQKRRPDLPVAGPIQYDAAIDPEVAKIKMPDNPVAGHATIFIFPDLDTGNIAYKAVQRSSGAVAVGPVMQGLRKPVNDLSRGCTIDDIIDTVAITAIQAQEEEA
ncbi:phosphate acetyltransferase [Nitratifractor salsuginis]|uniref:Phosphate acetyltransferase n=1 Tax=Nitratifractor salsuginis (strain DSM 16511 / JCM 12458 / E9I37-1) TaxID=749222 RepID=E6X289_NITSE|nr:phosphate acetyltransferase [Nitratifractor salsuginis]ADV46024.1 phosphate acetyltransferase [Nitratifractor salsuginis DSM 16511]